ncbi:class I adenylate-forming enzyme family protein [Stella sp.]|uniref:class I adenylate-forming enzyme family protein n=1 Tax=Stella sp. TaxID=2912054 RepID=UPI0035B1CA83
MGWVGCDIEGFARARPAAAAILAGDRVVSWRDFHCGIAGAAAAYHARGIGPGRVVSLVLRDRPQDLMALFALLRLGAPVLTLDPGEPAALGRSLAERAGAAFFVGDPGDPAPPGTVAVALGDFAPGDGGLLPPPPGPDRVAFVNRSSGTTQGVPKLACQSHGLLAWRRGSLGRRLPVGVDDRYLALVSIAFAYGRYSALRHLEAGAAVVLPAGLQSVAGLMDLARAARVTATSVTPLHLRDLARSGAPGPILPGVRIHCSTAALSDAELRTIRARVSREIYVGYGSNEVGTVAMAVPDDLDRKPGTVGRPLAGIAAEAAAADGTPCPPGRVGELRFRHPAFAPDYLDAAVGATSRFAGGWFHPGDLGLVDEDGYVFLRGRIDDVINVGGRKLHPGDAEAALERHPAVVEAAVVGLDDPRRGSVAVAAVVLREPCAPGRLLRHCAAVGAGPAPGRVVVMDALPRTPIGKIDRRALAATLAARLHREGGAPG